MTKAELFAAVDGIPLDADITASVHATATGQVHDVRFTVEQLADVIRESWPEDEPKPDAYAWIRMARIIIGYLMYPEAMSRAFPEGGVSDKMTELMVMAFSQAKGAA